MTNKYKYQYILLKNIANNEYPYYNLFYKLDIDKFKLLVKKFKPKIVNNIPNNISNNKINIKKFNNQYTLIEEDWKLNEELNNITDYFTENCRVKCEFTGNISPLEYWTLNKTRILKHLVDTHKQNLSINIIRDYIYSNTKLCNNFRISVAISILQIFNARRWLDISAGWGDRLCAAIAHDVELYCGTDPNECLHPGYNRMIDLLVDPTNRNKYILLKGGFEEVKLPDIQFDLVFSSPPFFDFEIYSDNPDDSVIKYNTTDKWYNNFLIKSLDKAHAHLISGGHMVLYMGEGIRTNYISDMIDYLDKLMINCGNIYYYYPGARNIRKMYVWKKK